LNRRRRRARLRLGPDTSVPVSIRLGTRPGPIVPKPSCVRSDQARLRPIGPEPGYVRSGGTRLRPIGRNPVTSDRAGHPSRLVGPGTSAPDPITPGTQRRSDRAGTRHVRSGQARLGPIGPGTSVPVPITPGTRPRSDRARNPAMSERARRPFTPDRTSTRPRQIGRVPVHVRAGRVPVHLPSRESNLARFP
jgi:hypothetical protein